MTPILATLRCWPHGAALTHLGLLARADHIALARAVGYTLPHTASSADLIALILAGTYPPNPPAHADRAPLVTQESFLELE